MVAARHFCLGSDASYDAFGNILDSWNISFYNFTWAGGHGYRQTGLAFSSVYVRARHYSPLDGGWTTRDPLWPSEMPYGYVDGRVPGSVDPSGMETCGILYMKAVRTCYCYSKGKQIGSKKSSFSYRKDDCVGCIEPKLIIECSASTNVTQSGGGPNVGTYFQDLSVKCSGAGALLIEKLSQIVAAGFNNIGRHLIQTAYAKNPCTTKGAYVSCSIEAQYVMKLFVCGDNSKCSTVTQGYVNGLIGDVVWEKGKPKIVPIGTRN